MAVFFCFTEMAEHVLLSDLYKLLTTPAPLSLAAGDDNF